MDELSSNYEDILALYERSLLKQEQMEFPSARGGGSNDDKTLFEITRKEIHTFFCGSEKHYQELRKQIKSNEKHIIAFLSGAVATALASFGLSIGAVVISTAVSLVFQITVKVGSRALCEYAEAFEV